MSLLIRVPDQYEPLRKNRYLVRFPADLGIAEWWVRSASRPSLDINNVEVPFMNTSNYVSGRFKWDTLTITFIDPVLYDSKIGELLVRALSQFPG